MEGDKINLENISPGALNLTNKLLNGDLFNDDQQPFQPLQYDFEDKDIDAIDPGLFDFLDPEDKDQLNADDLENNKELKQIDSNVKRIKKTDKLRAIL